MFFVRIKCHLMFFLRINVEIQAQNQSIRYRFSLRFKAAELFAVYFLFRLEFKAVGQQIVRIYRPIELKFNFPHRFYRRRIADRCARLRFRLVKFRVFLTPISFHHPLFVEIFQLSDRLFINLFRAVKTLQFAINTLQIICCHFNSSRCRFIAHRHIDILLFILRFFFRL